MSAWSRPGRLNGRSLPEGVIDDRIRRYMNGEPLALIAKDHGVALVTICQTIRRHAPSIAGTRPRGGGPKPWPPEAS